MIRHEDTRLTKLFVGGIPYDTDDESLREFFVQFGEIKEAVVIRDRDTLQSKGYGFVTFHDKDCAEKACVNKRPVIDGRTANVNLAYLGAKPKSSKGQYKILRYRRFDVRDRSILNDRTRTIFLPTHYCLISRLNRAE